MMFSKMIQLVMPLAAAAVAAEVGWWLMVDLMAAPKIRYFSGSPNY
jgi:hypothetical protein